MSIKVLTLSFLKNFILYEIYGIDGFEGGGGRWFLCRVLEHETLQWNAENVGLCSKNVYEFKN